MRPTRPIRPIRLYLAGHQGMVGSAILRQLQRRSDYEVIVRTRAELDLTRQAEVEDFFQSQKPDAVILAAAKVGGILANNSFPASFIAENLSIQSNVIQAAHLAGVQRLLFLGSSCIYPANLSEAITEERLLTGPLEPTNEPYALAKITGIKMCESYNRQFGRDYRSVMPCNLYGPGDNFHPEHSHVIPGLMRRFHEASVSGAEQVVIWGSGRPRREFLHVDDMAAACLWVLELAPERHALHTAPARSHLNVGTGVDCSIAELAQMLARIAGYGGRIVFDPSKPDGTRRKLLDVSRLGATGWRASVHLEEGLRETYAWFVEHQATLASGATSSH